MAEPESLKHKNLESCLKKDFGFYGNTSGLSHEIFWVSRGILSAQNPATKVCCYVAVVEDHKGLRVELPHSLSARGQGLGFNQTDRRKQIRSAHGIFLLAGMCHCGIEIQYGFYAAVSNFYAFGEENLINEARR